MVPHSRFWQVVPLTSHCPTKFQELIPYGGQALGSLMPYPAIQENTPSRVPTFHLQKQQRLCKSVQRQQKYNGRYGNSRSKGGTLPFLRKQKLAEQ
jgi:hypothetical protein